MKRYGAVGDASRELLTYGGLVLTHTDRAELEYLLANVRVVELPTHIPPEDTLPIAAHPAMSAVRFPLRREEFR